MIEHHIVIKIRYELWRKTNVSFYCNNDFTADNIVKSNNAFINKKSSALNRTNFEIKLNDIYISLFEEIKIMSKQK